MLLRTKVLLLQSLAVVAALAALLGVIDFVVSAAIRQKDETAYRERLHAVLVRVAAEQSNLVRNGLESAGSYVEEARRAVVEDLARDAVDADGGYLLVLDRDGRVVLHPKRAALAGDYAGAAWARAAAAATAGTARVSLATVDGEPAWLLHDRFQAWGWTVVYVVPEVIRKAAVHRLLWILTGLSAGALAVVLLINLWGHRRVSRSIRGAIGESDKLRQAVAAGRLGVRGDAGAVEAELRPVVSAMNEALDAFTGPFQESAAALDKIARGLVLDPIDTPYEGDFNAVKNSINAVTRMVRSRAADVEALVKAAVEGRLDVRADLSRYEGGNKKVLGGINAMLDALSAPILVAADSVARIGRGEIPPPITGEYKGEFNTLRDNLNRSFRAVSALLEDADGLARAAVEGRLSTRADASRHEGDFRKVIEGVNRTLDAVIAPLQLAARYVDDISKGRIPEKITVEQRGDFGAVKDNLNGCIDAVRLLVGDVNALAAAAVAGKLDTRADVHRHRGEFACILSGVNHTLDAVLAPIDEATATLEALAARDLRARVKGEYRGDHARIAGAVNGTAAALGEALAQVAGAVEQVASAATQIASSSQAVASGATAQASSLAETTTSLDAVAAMTRHAADSAQQANQLSQSARASADAANGPLDRLRGAMGRIQASAEGTSQIIKDVSDIAFQTNLLALNAAVEAARAGDAGRGFAVVAEEVRSLALRAREAAGKTEALIRESVKDAGEGEAATGEVAGALAEIASGVGKVTDIVAEIAASAREQASGLEQVVKAVAETDRVTQQNAASAEESSSVASELSGQAEELATMVGAFQLERGAGFTRGEACAARSLPDASPRRARAPVA